MTDATESLTEWFWARHSNPWSAGTRFAIMPLLLSAIYHRRWRLLVAVIGFTVVNPVMFPEPDRTDNWLSEVVLAERWWYEGGHTSFEPRFPSLLNYLSVPATVLALYGAISRRPRLTVVGGVCAMLLKVWFVDELVGRYRDADDDSA